MRAAVLSRTGGPEVLTPADIVTPRPGPGEVLVQVAACGVCGHDQADRAGLLDIPLPAVLGHEISGVVVETGPRVTRIAPGDRVAAKQYATCGHCDPCTTGDELRCAERAFTYGGYAEYAVLRETSLLTVPADVDLVAASVVACAVGTVLQALRARARLRSGETVLVTGAGGGLGLHGIQVATALGARVLALTGNPNKADRLRQLGADDVVVAGNTAWQSLLDATGGRGVDVVLDNVGHPDVFRHAFRALADRGRYVLTGQVGPAPLRLHPAFLFAKDAMITGSGSTLTSTFSDALAMVADGRVTPLVTRYPLDDVVRAFNDLDGHRVTGRAVLVPATGGPA
ncbi:alcohol dehydrogenase catalytic domain-containing protein [Streptomyces chartreusis]